MHFLVILILVFLPESKFCGSVFTTSLSHNMLPSCSLPSDAGRCRCRCFFWLQVFFYLAILVKLCYRVSPRVCTEVSMHFNFLQRKYPRAGWTGTVSSGRVGSLCINIITGSTISGLLWDTSFLWLFHCNARISKKWWSWLTDSESEAALRLSMSLVLLNQKYNLEKGFPSSSLYQLSIKGFALPGRVSTTVWSR